jgi:hypothetical protein
VLTVNMSSKFTYVAYMAYVAYAYVKRVSIDNAVLVQCRVHIHEQ